MRWRRYRVSSPSGKRRTKRWQRIFELSELDRKIQLDLAPVSKEQEKKQDLYTFKLETIHKVNPNKDFICIRPENGYNKGRKNLEEWRLLK